MTDELVAFLRARLAEQRDLATRIKERFTTRGEYAKNPGEPYWPTGRVAKVMRDYPDPEVAAQGDLIEMFSPDRVIAQVDADLRIVDLHGGGPHECPEPDDSWGARTVYERECLTLRYLALRWDSHPEYDERWRPE